ncbi:MAG TPA: PEP-CTERM sorting domain-containing protein [Candidatus Acidoferrales bacterium]|jgi:hypothetical protein|nr:PEP-CTERM sorting domain-containing protein [Candidatus Acidoferrales bacterium]
MKTSIIKYIISVTAIAAVQPCYSQSFINLNFESANVSGYSTGAIVPTQDAFPDWSAYYGPPSDPTHSGSLSSVFYDTIGLGGAFIALEDSNAPAPYGPIQGNYSAFLGGSIPTADTTASLGQTGTIPRTAQSIIFWESTGGSLDVSFNGQALSLVDVSNAVNYTVYAADISSIAGETGQLLFTAPVNSGAVLDNIQFSTSSVPEPSTVALCTLGGLSLAWRRRQKSSA